MNRTFDITHALQSLHPNSVWSLEGDDYSGLTWLSEDIKKPTKAALEKEAARLQAEYDALEYQRLRAPEYPSMSDYLDGIVKGDDAQVQAYIDACLAVKAKYPKPE
jgi:hypothetical protein